MLPAGCVVAAAELADEDWQNAWREQIRARRFGRLWLTPADEPPASRGGCQIRLHMGLAFGTGAHPTTALCLDWLEKRPRAGERLIDFGCGSGVLAIAALALGARRAFAVDDDDQALEAAARNAELNGLSDAIWIGHPDDLPALTVDLIAANIVANTLMGLAGTFAGRVRPGGAIVLSGILPEQADSVQSAFAQRFEQFERTERDGWTRLSAVRSAHGGPPPAL
jgi:ribosomal protein L11 methyltransferase